MRVRRAELMGRSVRPAKSNWNIELPTRHREHVWRIVDYLIEGNQGKTKRHELNNWPQPDHCRTDSHSRKTVFADRGIDDPSRSEAIEQSLADFVSAVVFGDFFAHQKDIRIALQLLGQRFVQSLTVCDLSH